MIPVAPMCDDDQPLSDTEAYDRLHAARLALGTEPGETTRGNTALEASRRALAILQAALLKGMENEEDQRKTPP